MGERKEDPRERLLDDAFAREIGVKLNSMEPGKAEAQVTIESRHLNGEGVAQGGVMFTLADFTFAAAANAYGPSALGMDGNMMYHRPGMLGDTLTAVAEEINRGRVIGRYEVNVRNQDGKLLATFHGTAYIKS